uniref:Putative ovule protein n=1 Tax=Solanum chacoense TaxID=4108 RepID=A0A0V0HQ65_SOLCH
MSAHPSQHLHLYHSHLLHMGVFDWLTIYLIKHLSSYFVELTFKFWQYILITHNTRCMPQFH